MQNLLLLFSSIAMFAGALFGGMYLGRKGQKESKEKAIDKRSEAKEIILEAEDEARRIRLSTAETEKVLQQRSERVDQKESQLLAKEKSLEEAKVLQNKKIEEKKTKLTEETIQLGKEFADKYLKEDMPVVVALSGELGAGKTQFTKGIAQSLGVKEIVNSPTYTIINEYPYMRNGVEKVLAHMDTWRLENNELEKSGLIQHLEQGNIVVIEWADKFYQEIAALCDNMNIPMYKVVIKYISLEERNIEIYEA